MNLNDVLLVLVFIFVAKVVVAQETKVEIKYEYKKYEKVDLGDLSVKGNIVTPGDLSVNERAKRLFERPLPERMNYDNENKADHNFIN